MSDDSDSAQWAAILHRPWQWGAAHELPESPRDLTTRASEDAEQFGKLGPRDARTRRGDLTLRHVARLPNPVVPHYTAVYLRYGWRVRPQLELSLVVRNAFDAEHVEFNDAPARSEIERDVYGQIRWSF